MRIFSTSFIYSSALAVSLVGLSEAGQISVINPSAGTEVTGVVTITSLTPSTTIATVSPQGGPTTNLSSLASIGNYGSARVNAVAAALAQFNVERFSQAQRRELIALIGELSEDRALSSGARAVLEAQMRRLKGLR